MSLQNIQDLQQNISYYFTDIRLLKIALTHRSYMSEKERDSDITEHNERLEFLGDAVLELVVTDFLFNNLNDSEGMLTAIRAALVNYKTTGEAGQFLGLENLMNLSHGEKLELGKARVSIVADAVEAIIGAIYLDGGIEPCKNFIKQFILVYLQDILDNKLYRDAKTELQEQAQKHFKITPHYKILFSEGKDHEKMFHVGVLLNKDLLAEGEGRSKQKAETIAAENGLEILKNKTENL